MKYFFSLFAVSTLIFSETSIVAETKINQKVIIESNDLMKFDKTSIKLSKGVTYDIVLKNVGKLPKAAMGHNLIILDQGNDAIAFGAKLIPPTASCVPIVIRKTGVPTSKLTFKKNHRA